MRKAVHTELIHMTWSCKHKLEALQAVYRQPGATEYEDVVNPELCSFHVLCAISKWSCIITDTPFETELQRIISILKGI